MTTQPNEAMINQARELLMIPALWRIYVQVIDDSPERSGSCVADPSSMTAEINIASAIIGSDHEWETTLHELLHVVHSEIDTFIHMVIDELPSKRRQEFLGALYYRHNERLITHLARAIVALTESQRGEASP